MDTNFVWPSTGDSLQDIAFCNASTSDWGYMSVNASGGETWHAVGPSSTDYIGF